jgi:glycine cleavage system H protein
VTRPPPRATIVPAGAAAGGPEDEEGRLVEYPDDVRYTKEHEWARPEPTGIRVGITDYAQDALGDVVYVDLPEIGAEVHAGQPLGEVESTKSVSDVFSPLDGAVVERNALIEEHPELVNEQPYGDGWLVLIEATDPAAVDGLMDAAAYRAFVDGEQP